MSDDEQPPDRVLIWFSCGATSAVAGKLALAEWPAAEVIRMRIETEHPDGDRFAADVSRWYGRPIWEITGQFGDHLKAIRYHRYINGPTGAKCTRELKRKPREQYQRPGDLHVFGFDADEGERTAEFRERNPDLRFVAPLVDAGLTKGDCKLILGRAGIELPAMYRLGYANNNCIGCVKGGAGYWNKIRRDFPQVFAEMAAIEREIGHTVLRHRKGPDKGKPLFLDQLDPASGRFAEDQPADCGVLCQAALARVGLDQPPELTGGC